MTKRKRAARLGSTLGRVRDRDNDTCQLCFEWVDPSLPPTDGWGGTVDHILPKSMGGQRFMENLRLAHRRCNSWRGDRDVALPMRRAPGRRIKVPYSYYFAMYHTERYEGSQDPKLMGQLGLHQPWRRIRLQELPPLAQNQG